MWHLVLPPVGFRGDVMWTVQHSQPSPLSWAGLRSPSLRGFYLCEGNSERTQGRCVCENCYCSWEPGHVWTQS